MTPEDLSLSQSRHPVGKSKPISWSYRDGPPKETENGTSLSTGDLLDDLIKGLRHTIPNVGGPEE